MTATTLVDDSAVKRALDSDGTVEAIHLAEGKDHRWNLIKQEKENLRKYFAER